MPAALAALALAAAGPPPVLRLPIACEVGRSCVVQQWADDQPGPGVKDFRCGPRTYEGHDGIDVRLPSLAAQRAGIDVLAAADGVVRGARDGMADVSLRDQPPEAAQRAAVKGRECGNGVALVHPGGWETQYCHMARGSVAVRPGQAVRAGERLGRVGLSGDTEFPHLHVTVRQDGKAVDPFAWGRAPGACEGGRSLWAPAAGAALSRYEPVVLAPGFAPGPVTDRQVDEDGGASLKPGADAPALVAFARVIGLLAGDRQVLVLVGPDGRPLSEQAAAPLATPKAQTLSFTGLRRKADRWPPGLYRARMTILRDGRPVATREETLRLGG